MNPKEIYEEWTSGETNGLRPARVQAVRADLEDAIDMRIPRRVSEIEGWLSAMSRSGVITRRLAEATRAFEEGEEPDWSGHGDDDDDDEADDEE